MGQLRLAFLRTVYVTSDNSNDVRREDHVVMECDQGELLEELKSYLDKYLVGDSWTKQEIWPALDHAALDLVADFKRKSVRLL